MRATLPAKINVLFPVEILNRELDFRLWLAVLYAHPRCRIFIGQHDELAFLAGKLRGGLYVGKNVFLHTFPVDLERYRAIKDRGFTVIHLDEEGLAAGYDQASFERYLGWRIDPSVFAKEDWICTWGDSQRDVYRRTHVNPDHVRTTGHPRFDLYNQAYRAYFDDDVARLRARHGKYILINTNLSHANNGLGVLNTFSSSWWYDRKDERARINHFNGWAHQTHLLANLVKLVNAMALRWPGRNIIVRPHPSEDWTFYESVFCETKNVKVIHEGPVGPWLFASEVLIHHACTTAIEAHLSEVPVIDYKSYDAGVLWEDENRLPEKFGALVTTESEVLDLVERLESKPSALHAARLTPELLGILANFGGASSFDKLVTIMREAEAELRPGTGGDDGGIKPALALRLAKKRAKNLVRPLFREKMAMYRFLTTNSFYGFDEAYLARKFEVIGRLTKKKVRWEMMGSDVICVEAHDGLQ